METSSGKPAGSSRVGGGRPLFVSGFFWQPVTYIFLHGSTAHLALNLCSLLLFGSLVELAINHGQVAYAAHLIGGLAGYLIGRRWAREWPPEVT